LNENILEIKGLAQDSLDDAIIMSVDEKQFKKVMIDIIQSLSSKYADKK
tara:strand:- start:104 stop:250 length:147 start_codon:yes stop_codon:yes gene_type:complete